MESLNYRVLCVFLEIPICFFLQFCLPLAPEDLRNAVQLHVLSNPKGELYCSRKIVCSEFGPCEPSLELPRVGCQPPTPPPAMPRAGFLWSPPDWSKEKLWRRRAEGTQRPRLLLDERSLPLLCECSPRGGAVPVPLVQCKTVIWQA